jgi:hypothetical protein
MNLWPCVYTYIDYLYYFFRHSIINAEVIGLTQTETAHKLNDNTLSLFSMANKLATALKLKWHYAFKRNGPDRNFHCTSHLVLSYSVTLIFDLNCRPNSCTRLLIMVLRANSLDAWRSDGPNMNPNNTQLHFRIYEVVTLAF